MKFQTTKKAIENGYNNVISVPYCELQYLLYFDSPVAYTANKYGWQADIYNIENAAIVTGYAPFGNIKPRYTLCRRYDDIARDIIYSNLSSENQREQITALKRDFLQEAIK
jgi:hypothetical protein